MLDSTEGSRVDAPPGPPHHLALLIRPNNDDPNRVDVDGVDWWSKQWLQIYGRQVEFLMGYYAVKRALPELMTHHGLEKVAAAICRELEQWGRGQHVNIIGHNLPLDEYTFSVEVAHKELGELGK